MYQALYRKWRPQRFEDVVGQSHITMTLRTQVASGRLSHAYLFTGTRGTGKTTCAKILAKAVNCEHPVNGDPCNACPTCRGIDEGSVMEVVEIDAASNNGVDYIRALREEAVYSPANAKKRVYIVDEVHMLSTGAFNALLKTLEEPPEHLMFILATTELHKVPATILSRCQRFSFRRITAEDIQGRLLYVAGEEKLELTPDGAALLARLADGALRDGLSLLDQCAATPGTIDREAVLNTLGLAGNLRIAHLMNHIRRGNTGKALEELADLYAAGKGIPSVLSELSDLIRDLLIQKTAAQSGGGLMAGGYDAETLSTLGKSLSAQRLLQMLKLLQDTQASLRTSSNQRTDAELCLIRLCDERLDSSAEGLSARLARLEAALEGGIALAPAPVPTAEPVYEPALREAPVQPQPEPVSVPQSPMQDAPPWDEPVQPAPAVQKAPAPAPRSAAPAPKPAPAPSPARQAAAVVTDRFWETLLPLIKGKLASWAYLPLTDKSNVAGRLENDTVVIYCTDKFTDKRINKENILRAVGQAASAKTGRAINAVAKQGTAPAVAAPVSKAAAKQAAPQNDPFQSLIQKGRELGADIQ